MWRKLKWMDRSLKLGMSLFNTPPGDIGCFVDEGFTFFEISLSGNLGAPGNEAPYADVSAEYFRAMRRSSVQPWSFHLPFARHWDISARDENLRRLASDGLCSLMRRVGDAGLRYFIIHGCGVEPISDEERDIRVAQCLRSLTELSKQAERVGAALALENLPRTCIGRSTAEMRALLGASGCEAVCFDVNHLLCDTHDQFLDGLLPRIVTTHLSDYDGLDEKHWLPGQGVVPWRRNVERLCDGGYTGPFLFELTVGPNGAYSAREIREAFLAALTDGKERA